MAQTPVSSAEPRTRVFLDELPWDIRSKNTDWRYVRFALPKLATFEPELELTMQSSRWITVRENAKVLRAALGRRLGMPMSRYQELTSELAPADLRKSRADVIFAHRAFPLNAGAFPVIWQNSVLDPDMQLSYGATTKDIEAEITIKGPLYRKATALQVSSSAEVRRLSSTFPDIADKFEYIPFFTPHAQSCTQEHVKRQLSQEKVRILFVANQPMLKRLDLLLEAYSLIPRDLQFDTELVIVSNFQGPAVRIPSDPRIHVIKGADHTRVMQEMHRSNIFVNVSQFESYGLVFHEAMSQGLACIAPDWEVQRELFDYGSAGRLIVGRADALQKCLEELIFRPELRYQLGAAAWTRFNERYAPAVVARKYADLFRRVARCASNVPT